MYSRVYYSYNKVKFLLGSYFDKNYWLVCKDNWLKFIELIFSFFLGC
jgi:hypothetical protein